MVEKKSKHTRTEKDSFTVKINVDGDEVSVECFLNEWNFNELDKWIRSRFGLKADEPLRYMDNLGAEIFPTKSFFQSHDTLFIKKIKSSSKPTPSITSNQLFQYFYLALTTAIIFIGIYSNFIPIKQICLMIDGFLIKTGFLNKSGMTLDAFIAIVSWSSTYLFIRRLLNPENKGATFEKFSADSFFGGLAAGCAVFMKHIVSSALSSN